MKSAVLPFVAFLCISTVGSVSTVQGSPVEKVVNLLTTLKAQTESDSKAEQQIYDKYACWCEKT
jgi:hypothetical protein